MSTSDTPTNPVQVHPWPGFLARFTPHPPRPPQAVTGRAGRNLPAAVATAIVLLSLVAVCIFIKVEAFIILVLVAQLIGLWEMTGAFLNRGFRLPLVPLWVGALLMTYFTWQMSVAGGVVAFLISSALVFVWRTLDGDVGASRDSLAAVFGSAWISLMACFAIALTELPHASWVLAIFILLPVANDTGGWLAGIFFGKHPMAPTVSPKKSWEGFAGSVALTVAVAMPMGYYLAHIPLWVAAILGLACVIASTLGDLSESLLKRDLGVKDMGSLFPGHGGVLDRVDSMLFCAPLCYAVFHAALA